MRQRHQARPGRRSGAGGRLEPPVPEHQAGALAHAAARPDQRLPHGAAVRAQQEQFDRPPVGPSAAEARRDHARVVEHEHVARAQELRQVAKRSVRYRPIRAAQHEQPRAVPGGGRRLRDPVPGQGVVELREPHRPIVATLDARRGGDRRAPYATVEETSDAERPRC